MDLLPYTAGDAGLVAKRMLEHAAPANVGDGVAIPTGKRTGTFPCG